MADRKLVFIVGVPHSGSTVFWRAFRQNEEFLCFDEPLTANIAIHFPLDNAKGTFQEYSDIYGSVPEMFWKMYRPIAPIEEASTKLDESKIRYLSALCSHSRVTVMDETHVSTMVPALKGVHDNIYIVHLVRRARAVVSSHLLPSRRGDIKTLRGLARRLRHFHNRSAFFKRHDFVPGMARNEVIGGHPCSKFGLLLRDAGYDHEKIMCAPAAVRLLAYWHYCHTRAQLDGASVFGERFRTIRYEKFAAAPRDTMAALYSWIGENAPSQADYGDVHSPKPAFRPNDSWWREYARTAGFSSDEIETLL